MKDTSERQHRIFVKATANAQRRKREAFLSAIPQAVADYLAQRKYVLTPEAGNRLFRILPITEEGIGSAPQHRARNYRFAAFGWPEKAMAFLTEVTFAENGADAFLSLWNPHQVSFAERSVIVPPLPLFAVDFRWIVGHLDELWGIADKFLAAFSVDLSVGFVVDSYCGLLEGDLNPAEIVYEVALWGRSHAD